jgi:hypothetical protein
VRYRALLASVLAVLCLAIPAGAAGAHPHRHHVAEASAEYWAAERSHQLGHRLSRSWKRKLERLRRYDRPSAARAAARVESIVKRRVRIAADRHRRTEGRYWRLVRLARKGGRPQDNRRLGRAMANERHGWTGRQWSCLRVLYIGESGWRHGARNASSGAFGIPQSLPARKLLAAGRAIRTAYVQLKWGLGYIAGRYGTPCGALGAWRSRSPHWY